MDQNDIRKIVQEEINSFMNVKQFNLSKIQNHTHNGTDCVKIKQSDILNGDTSIIGITSIATENFNVKVIPNTNIISLYGIAYDSSASPSTKKATLTGSAQLGRCFRYGTQSGSVIDLIGTYQPFLQTNNSIYIDTSDLTKTRVTADSAHLVYVKNDAGTAVATMDITYWDNNRISFATTLSANWTIVCFLAMS